MRSGSFKISSTWIVLGLMAGTVGCSKPSGGEKPAENKPAALSNTSSPAGDQPAAASSSSASTSPLRLTIGSPAPELNIEHWVSTGKGKFQPVTKFTPGQVYVVEFWATWCGPCVASMPHLAATQAKYADQGVQLISISDEELPTVQSFLERPFQDAGADHGSSSGQTAAAGAAGQPATYGELTSVYCLTTDPDRSSFDAYMEAAGQNGIPTAFIVGKTGLVEWIGHPMSMDDALAQVVAGTWDREKFAAEFRIEQEMNMLQMRAIQLARAGEVDKAKQFLIEARASATSDAAKAQIDELIAQMELVAIRGLAAAGKMDEALAAIEKLRATVDPKQAWQIDLFKFRLLLQAGRDDVTEVARSISQADVPAMVLNTIAWDVYQQSQQPNAKVAPGLVEVAVSSAERAASLEPTRAGVLDTLAHLLHLQGNLQRAIEVQTKAVELGGTSSQEIGEFLKKLQAESESAKP
ncbi:MAG: redoxin domain-containing protein [Pirellulales bacterium]